MTAALVIAIVVLLIAVVGWAIATYNGLIKLRNLVQEAWRQIDVELTRRHDLIGNLVETVKGYAAHERGTLEDVIKARAGAMAPGQSPAQQAESENMLSQALGRLLAIAEAYPDLKANQNFMALQAELTSTEDRIASARRYYNATVRDLNTKVETVPSNIIAGVFSISRAEYFEAVGEQREAPKVDFGQREAVIPPLATDGELDFGAISVPGVILMLTIFVLQGVAFGLALLNTPLAIVGALVLPTVWTILASAFPTVAKVAVWLDLNQVTGPLVDGKMNGADWAHLATGVGFWVVLPLAIGTWRVLTREVK